MKPQTSLLISLGVLVTTFIGARYYLNVAMQPLMTPTVETPRQPLVAEPAPLPHRAVPGHVGAPIADAAAAAEPYTAVENALLALSALVEVDDSARAALERELLEQLSSALDAHAAELDADDRASLRARISSLRTVFEGRESYQTAQAALDDAEAKLGAPTAP